MAIKDILKFVEKETARECEKILDDARRAVRQIEIADEEKRRSADAAFKKRIESARKAAIESAMRQARMTLRLETLNMKKRLLDEVYQVVAEKFKKELSDEKIVAFYEGLSKHIPRANQSPDAELIISSSETQIWKKVKNRPLCARVTESKDILKGFIYKTPTALWDFTLENLMAGFRAETESATAKELFGGEISAVDKQ